MRSPCSSPGVSIEQARAELSSIQARLAGNDAVRRSWSVGVLPLQQLLVESIRPALLILLAAVGFVLLIACANVANLLLARGARREREIAIRTAVGAGRWRIVRQMLAESLLLGILGGFVGLVAAMWGVDLLDRFMPMNIGGGRGYIVRPRIAIDGAVLAFTLALSLATSVIFGLAPAIAAAKPDLNHILKETGRAISHSRRRMRDLLVVSEVALALVLLICAGLTMKSFLRMQQSNPGFQADHVLTMEMELPTDSKYRTESDQAAFFRKLLERAGADAGRESGRNHGRAAARRSQCQHRFRRGRRAASAGRRAVRRGFPQRQRRLLRRAGDSLAPRPAVYGLRCAR